jgi:type IV secretory pathway VirB10-like protein
MSEPIPFDEHAERLKIRSSPKPVTRINRKVLMVGAGLGVLGLFAAMSIALKPPTAVDPDSRRELYNTTNTRTPEGLGALPASYSDISPIGTRITQLGPPLSGDLGATMLRAERELGLEPEFVTRVEDDFRPSPVDEAERARRMREAALADEAARAPVFFQLQSETGGQTVSEARPSDRDPAIDLGSELLALAALPQGAPSAFSQAADTNLQSRKLAFASEGAGGDIYNQHGVEDPASPYQVMAGTLIPASLVTGINSDLPGTIVAQVTQPVYDTVTGQYVLIPQGSRLIGRYQSEVSFGQNRALVTWIGSFSLMGRRLSSPRQVQMRKGTRVCRTEQITIGTASSSQRGSPPFLVLVQSLARMEMAISSVPSGAEQLTRSTRRASALSTAILGFNRLSVCALAGRCALSLPATSSSDLIHKEQKHDPSTWSVT